MSVDPEIALIVIGDEILKGLVQDVNTLYLAKALRKVGLELKRVFIVPDEKEIIAEEVHHASQAFSFVFTCGGVGPTHDDVTYEAVAQGFGLETSINKELLSYMEGLFPGSVPAKRLAVAPSPCEVIGIKRLNVKEGKKSSTPFPIIKVGNVYVLPGSPRYFQEACDHVCALLDYGIKVHSCSIDINMDEFDLISNNLESVVEKWLPQVAIGSYPQKPPPVRTLITLESRDWKAMRQAKREIEQLIPMDKILWKKFDTDMANKDYDSLQSEEHFAIDAIHRCYDQFQPNQIFLSFNGGKDCTAVLHLVAIVVEMRKVPPPICLYVTSDDDFEEVKTFVDDASFYYGVQMVHRSGSMRRVLTEFILNKPELKACLMGIRKGDPGSERLDIFTQTDPDWPRLMRVCPILKWSYRQVWKFLLDHEVPYCSLYDEGYTSLGSRGTTTKNPLLQHPNNPLRYLPAYTLADDSTERQGRG
ncbi:hypothetical protein TKK_0006187 [Trichogramma kaykai]|uniref:FAD synthase n=1 Tax=Trichogramma kaykai TaxID=54128 RepID=A0ABD2XFR8_9HYME